jgi:hypothetical protein
MADQPGEFFNQHMTYLMTGDLDGLLTNQYTPDAILITPFDILDEPPPHVIKNGPAMKDFFAKWLAYNANMQVDSLYDYAELDDTISFQCLLTSDSGKWVLGEAWHMAGDKIDRHYGFAHKLD